VVTKNVQLKVAAGKTYHSNIRYKYNKDSRSVDRLSLFHQLPSIDWQQVSPFI